MSYYSMKCTYADKGFGILLPDEYVITFKCLEQKQTKVVQPNGEDWPGKGEEWCIVPREHVTPETETSGLVKVTIFDVDFEKEKARIGIFSPPDKRIESFVVPLAELPQKP